MDRLCLRLTQWQPRVRSDRSNAYSAVCQNGGGVTRGTIAGILAADRACVVDNPLIAEIEKQGTPDRVPPRPFLDVGVHAKLAWDRYVHRDEV